MNTIIVFATLLFQLAAPGFTSVNDWLKLADGRPALGNMHGDIAVSANGDVYVSVQDPQASLQVYSPDGKFLRNVPNAPADLHGFVISKQTDGEFIFGVTLRGQTVVKIALDGTVAMTIPASAIPDAFKIRNARSGQLAVLLTDVVVAPNGDLYVADGYASDFIHRFDRTGKYITSFGGKTAPYSFNTLHKLAVDTRFQPARLIACDRANNRVVHLSLDGAFLGVVAQDLLLPAAIVISGDYAIVGELKGRASILDKSGKIIGQFGANDDAGAGTNTLKPEQWRAGVFTAPHGVAVNARGDLFVSEFNQTGRVLRFNRR